MKIPFASKFIKEVEFAIQVLQKSAPLARQIQKELAGQSVSKSDRSPVTVADFAVQAIVAYELAKAFPQDPLVGEESAKILRAPGGEKVLSKVIEYTAPVIGKKNPEKICALIDRGTAEPTKRFWTLDPIDGTKGFLRGAQYVIALALIIKGNVEMGILACPNLGTQTLMDDSKNSFSEKSIKVCVPRSFGGRGTLAVAGRGLGAWMKTIEAKDDFVRMKVSDCKSAETAAVIQSVEVGHKDEAESRKLLKDLGIRTQPLLLDSQVKHVVLAAGAGDMLFYFPDSVNPARKIKIWDQAAGALIIEEAGGKVTDMEGRPLDFGAGKSLSRNQGVLATNGHLHTAALKALKSL